MKAAPVSRISMRLATMTIVLAMLLGIVLGAVQVYADFFDEINNRDDTIQEILDVAKPSASRAVLLLDPDLASEVVQGLMVYPFVFSATISDEFGNQIGVAHREQRQQSNTRWLTTRVSEEMVVTKVVLDVPDNMGGRPGSMELVVDSDIFFSELYDRATITFLVMIATSILLSLLLFGIAHFLLARPLVSMVQQLEAVNPESPSADINIPRGHDRDELGMVARATNKLLVSIRNLLDQQRQSQERLAKARDELEVRVFERTRELQHEIGERRLAQEELAKANHKLEERVAERTAALRLEVEDHKSTAEELLRMKEQADAANLAKTAFLANMSHELRTPLNAIIGFSTIMSDQMFGPIENEKYLQYLKDIVNSGNHLSELLGNILDLAKVESGELKLHEENIVIDDFIHSCLDMFKVLAGRNNISLNSELTDKATSVLGDKTRLNQILINLISNSLKFTPDGGSISVLTNMTDKGDLRIAVRDTGIGIPEDKLETVLEPFVQVDISYSKTHQGVGLGLSLCRMLAELHEGRFWIESELGKGTTVFVELPAHRVSA